MLWSSKRPQTKRRRCSMPRQFGSIHRPGSLLSVLSLMQASASSVRLQCVAFAVSRLGFASVWCFLPHCLARSARSARRCLFAPPKSLSLINHTTSLALPNSTPTTNIQVQHILKATNFNTQDTTPHIDNKDTYHRYA